MSLIAHYKLDGNANDCSGFCNHGINYNVTWADGIYGLAGNFNGIDNTTGSNITIPVNSILEYTKFDKFSLSCWIKSTTLSGSMKVIIGQVIGNNINAGMVLKLINNEWKACLYDYSSNGEAAILSSTTTIQTNKWYYITITYNINKNTSIYINGTLENTVNYQLPFISSGIIIGKTLNSGFNRNFNGLIQDIRIYDHELSSLEIKELSMAKVLHYNFNYNKDNIVLDSSYSSNNIKISSNNPTWQFSNYKVGEGCFQWNGTDQFINCGNKPNVIYNQTIMMWLYPTNYSVRRNPYNKAFGGEGTITHEISGRLNYFYGTHGGDNEPYDALTSSIIPLNKWTHIAIIRDLANGSIKWYINGQLDTFKTTSYVNTAKSNADLLIGKGYTNPYHGYIDDVRVYATALSQKDINDIYCQNMKIDKYGNIFNINKKNTINHKNLLMNYTVWENGQTGSIGNFSQNASVSNENVIIIGYDPWGNNSVLWEARPDAISSADGGWNHLIYNINNKKMYRFSTWVWRNKNGNGTFYFGCYGYGSVNGLLQRNNGANNTNLYFIYDSNIPIANQWELIVAHIWPAGSGTGSNHYESGRYTINGKIGNISIDAIWNPETIQATPRTYLFYCTDNTVRQRWCYPRFDIIDGTEPSIYELLNGFDFKNYDYYKNTNGMTINIPFKANKKAITCINSEYNKDKTDNNLILYYKLNGNATDYSGNNFHGTISSVDFINDNEKGIIGNFNGTATNYIYNNDFNLGSDPIFSISGWFYRYSDINNCGPWGIGGGSSNTGISAYNSSNNCIGIDLWGLTTYSTTNIYPLNEWCFITWVKKEKGFNINDIEIYINGQLQNIKQNRYTASTPSVTPGIAIGKLSINSAIYTCPIKISNFKIFNKVLSADEIKFMYESEKDNKILSIKNDGSLNVKGEIKTYPKFNNYYDGLIGHWKLDKNTRDSTGKNSNGIITATYSILDRECILVNTSQRVLINNFSSTNSTTVTCWGYLTTVGGMLFSFDSASYSGPDLYIAASTVIWNKGDGSANPFKSGGVNIPYPELNKWIFYTVVNNESTGKAYLYYNGNLVGEANYYSTFQNNRNFIIGNYVPNYTEYAWNGYIADIRVYNRILSENEIKILYDFTKK